MKEVEPTILDKADDKKTYKGRSKIQKDGRVTIPKKVRDFLGVGIGDKVCLSLEGLNNDVLVIMKA